MNGQRKLEMALEIHAGRNVCGTLKFGQNILSKMKKEGQGKNE